MSESSSGGAFEHHGLAELEDRLIHHTELPRTAVSKVLDAIVEAIGAWTSWLWVVTVGVILYSVISRYAFSQGSVMLEEVQWHLAGATWLIGLSYTLVHDSHVRVDVLHERFSMRTKAWVELLGIAFLLLPFLVLAIMELLPYVMASFEQGEHSQAPNGLPWRWVLKSFLPISMGLLVIAAFSRLTRTSAFLFRFPRPLADDGKPANEGR